MTSSTADAGSPDHLLAIDLEALGLPDAEGWQRLGDRISAMRLGTVLVFVGGSGFVGLPEPDYVIEGGGASITRMPAMEVIDGWPIDGAEGVSEAIAHLAGELLIPWSEVYCVLGAARPRRADLERLVLIGGSEAPGTGVWLETAGADAVIEALETLQLFGRSVHSPTDVTEAGFQAAIETVRRNVTEYGFTAASLADNPLNAYDANYAAVWARDGVITGLWTLCLGDDELVDTFRRTIRVLAKHQSPTGQIPANVRLGSDQPDYSGIGGIASIDSVLWFVVGAVRLAFHTGDRELAVEIAQPVSRAMNWLAAHDANNDGLIEIPESSDWMDIFPRSYNVLYDEVLWWQACLDTAVLFEAIDHDGTGWRSQADRVQEQILHQFWPTGEQLMEIAGTQTGRFSPGEAHYLLSQITPFDYGWRCDVYANLLAALGGLLDERKLDRLFTFLWGVGVNSPYPVACLYPPIASGAEDWKDYFLVNFLNLPHHYHNGGLWPFIGGLWVRYLAAAGRVELAHRELASLAEACRQGVHDEWEFNEWLHGTTGRPMGKAHQAWSAASYIHAYLTLHGDAEAGVFPSLDPAALP